MPQQPSRMQLAAATTHATRCCCCNNSATKKTHGATQHPFTHLHQRPQPPARAACCPTRRPDLRGCLRRAPAHRPRTPWLPLASVLRCNPFVPLQARRRRPRAAQPSHSDAEGAHGTVPCSAARPALRSELLETKERLLWRGGLKGQQGAGAPFLQLGRCPKQDGDSQMYSGGERCEAVPRRGVPGALQAFFCPKTEHRCKNKLFRGTAALNTLNARWALSCLHFYYYSMACASGHFINALHVSDVHLRELHHCSWCSSMAFMVNTRHTQWGLRSTPVKVRRPATRQLTRVQAATGDSRVQTFKVSLLTARNGAKCEGRTHAQRHRAWR